MVATAKYKNFLLKALSPKEIASLLPDLQLVTLPLRQTLYEAASPFQYVYFPEDSLASVIMTMADGAMVEVGMIGAEGVVGMPALLGTGVSAQQVIVQAQGTAFRIDAGRCKAFFDRSEAFRQIILRFSEDFFNLAAQTSACNRLHSVEQRCARWLLMATDRMQSDNIPMTHEFLSAMLGTRRAGVTETAGELQRSGLIRYHHGQLTVVNRKGLSALACECYHADHVRLSDLEEKELA